jgi:hypothetical protein
MWSNVRQPPARRRSTTRDERDLIGWRREMLQRNGFGVELSSGLATDPLIDLHALIELVERGCLPILAVRILAPLDSGRAPSC